MPTVELESIEDFSLLAETYSEDVGELLALPEFFRSPEPSYIEQQEHSRYVDQILGFKIESLETDLNRSDYPNLESWVGLSPEQLQTPYDELLMMSQLLQLRDDEHVVDLGAGYGRLGLVLAQQAPKVQFTGYELVEGRVTAGNQIYAKHGIENSILIEQNLLADDFVCSSADVYFMYDYGQKEHLEHTLEQLNQKSFDKPFRLIARGRGTRSLIHYQFPRLCHAVDPIHFSTFSLYSTP